MMHDSRTAAPDSTAGRVSFVAGHARPGRSAAACARRRDRPAAGGTRGRLAKSRERLGRTTCAARLSIREEFA